MHPGLEHPLSASSPPDSGIPELRRVLATPLQKGRWRVVLPDAPPSLPGGPWSVPPSIASWYDWSGWTWDLVDSVHIWRSWNMLNCLGSPGWRIAQCPDPGTTAVGTCDASSGAGFGTISAAQSSVQVFRNI